MRAEIVARSDKGHRIAYLDLVNGQWETSEIGLAICAEAIKQNYTHLLSNNGRLFFQARPIAIRKAAA